MASPRFSVSGLIAALNQTLEFAYASVEIEGEVSSFKINQGKFVFFDLKDDEGSVGCFMMAWQLRMPIEDGMRVVIVAAPKLTNWGKFSLTVRLIKPVGEGSLRKGFELLKAKLDAEGLFSPDRKRTLPELPKRIAVVSSTAAAGYADFIKILGERFGGLEIQVAHVQVQGLAAPDQIIAAIRHFNTQEDLADVLVIVRGGGSADDLSAFNDELLVREIAASRIPVLTGIGHETDQSLSDLVADKAASTPSNAAQILIPDRRELIQDVRHMMLGVLPKVEREIEQQRDELLEMLYGCLDKFEDDIETTLAEVQSTAKLLGEYDPVKVLSRGYAIVRGEAVIGGTIVVERKQELIEAEVKHVESR